MIFGAGFILRIGIIANNTDPDIDFIFIDLSISHIIEDGFSIEEETDIGI